MVTMNTKGGLFHYTTQISNALSSRNEVIILAPSGAVNKLLNNSVKLLALPMGNTIKNFLFNIIFFNRLYIIIKIIKREKPDVIHFQSTNLWGAFISLLLKMMGYVIVTTIHDVKPHLGVRQFDENIALNIQLRVSDCIIVHGKNAKEELIRQNKTKAGKIFIIPHGNYTFFTNYAEKNIQETNSILFFGNILEYKGLEYLIKAEPLIAKEIPNVKITIAGKGAFYRYRKLINNITKFEIYNKFIPDEEVPFFFQRAKVIILPYIEGTQTGIIPIAYAFKKPVVVTNVGSISEFVYDGKTGLIVTPKDEKALATAIIKLLKDDQLRKQMGENAYKMMKEELSWDKITEKTIKVYKTALNNKDNQ